MLTRRWGHFYFEKRVRMAPVSSILVLGKASFERMDFSVVFSAEKGQLWVRPKPRGGAAFTQKSERLSDQIQKTSFQIWDLIFAPRREQLFWHLNVSSAPGKRLAFFE
mmetsp:Transcript_5794/g.12447  ORF Transcript_5794/g.12447 Transcript_5794/m.12447 type:complete len:108 (+) Transcript_5794:62-385(+)